MLTSLADHVGGSAGWLKGPYGPPFFNISLFMGVMYGAIAWALSRERATTLFGLLGPFLGIAAPMLVLTRISQAIPWLQIVVALFVGAVWATIFVIGWRAGRGWLGGVSCMLGALLGYGVLTAIQRLAPGLTAWPWRAGSYLPQPTVLLDGFLTGGGMGLGIWFARCKHENAG